MDQRKEIKMATTPTSQTNDSPKPADVAEPSNGFLARTSERSPALAILAALLIPPLGLALAIIIGVKSKRPRKAFLTITLLVVSIIGTVGYIYLNQHVVITYRNPTAYNYQSAKAGELSTVQAAGMSFLKPSEFTSTAKKSDQNFSTESFSHLNQGNYPLGHIFVFSYQDNHASNSDYIKGVNDFMSGAVKNTYSQQYMEAIKKQVFDSYPSYSATLGAPQKFVNANIKENAWSFSLDITSSNPQVKPMKGKLVYVLGPGTIYYFSLMITQDNWVPNMATWQAMLSSLKLN